MRLSLEDALELVDPIMKLQEEVDEVNNKEFAQKYRVKKKCMDELRWDEKHNRLRYPCVTPEQEHLIREMHKTSKLIPRFWSTALSASCRILEYMNEEEKEIMLNYLKSVKVAYHGNAKTGFTIYLSYYENPHFDNLFHSKTFRFTREGIYGGRGSGIRQKMGKDIEVFPEKAGTQLHTDMPSFFKWFMEKKNQDFLAEEIVLEFWPNAHEYYLTGKEMGLEKPRQMPTERQRARKKSKHAERDLEYELMTIIAKLETAEEEATQLRYTREIEYESMLVKGEREVHKKSEIIHRIPHFWLIVFLSHYALHNLLSEEDQKIFKFLNSVDVEETEDGEGVISGYTITLNFDENPYFKNHSLKKTISYAIMSTDRPIEFSGGEGTSTDLLKEYNADEVNIRVSDIHWKDGMDITSGRKDITIGHERGFTNTGTSFFTWFSDRGDEVYDEVADLIKQDLWPDAGRYFVYGNLDDEKMVDLKGINKTAQFTSSSRAFFLF
ncbi:hypothetical protein MKX03_009052 [Papaver bracteatum]|nr:hypothetical protein MKX03_009052 [Papaver bracteatum]